MTTPIPSSSPLRPAWGLAGAMLAGALVSWVRFARGGTLNVQDLQPAQDLVLGLAFAAAFAVAALLYFAVLGRAKGPVEPSLLLAAMLVHLSASPSLPLTSNDVFPNLAYGRLATLGRSPAATSASDLSADDPFQRLVDPQWRGRVSVYGPVLNAISGACARTGQLLPAFVLFKLAMLAAALATLVVFYGFCRKLGAQGAWAFSLLAFNPLLAWEVAGQAHNDGVMLLAMAGFLWAAAAGKQWLASLLLALGFAAKFAVAPLLLLHLLSVLRRSAWRGAVTAAAVVFLVAALFAPSWSGASTLSGPGYAAVPAPDHIVNSLGALPLFAARLLSPPVVRPWFLAWAGLTGLFLAVQGLACAWRSTTLEAVLRNALLFTLLYECLGMLWYEPWYATWLLPLAAACGDRRLAGIAACYTVLVPMLYHPTELFGLAVLASHGLALVLLWRGGFLGMAKRPASTPVAAYS